MAWPFVLGIVALLAVALVSLNILMALRAYGYGENLWVKNQKNASMYLLRYAQTGQPQLLQAFDESLRVSQDFRAAREQMLAGDYQQAKVSAVRVGLPPDDADKVVWMHRYLGGMAVFDRLFTVWTEAEQLMLMLVPVRDQLKAHYDNVDAPFEGAPLTALSQRVEHVSDMVTPKSLAFSKDLQDATYTVYLGLTWFVSCLALLLSTWVVVRTWQLLGARQRVQSQLDVERQRSQTTLAAIGDAVININAQGQVVYMNPAAQRLTGHDWPAPEHTGQPLLADIVRLVRGRRGREQVPVQLPQILQQPAPPLQEEHHYMVVRSDGAHTPVTWAASSVQGVEGSEPDGVVLVLHDSTRERNLIDSLSWLASHDPLTDLPNRREFEVHLQQALHDLQTGGAARGHVMLFVDLDQFKVINDTCGHLAGDALLRQITIVLRSHLRESDVLARMGGDEFGVLFLDCPLEVGRHKAECLRRAAHEMELAWEGRRFAVSTSIGLVHITPAHTDLGALLRAADMACYTAKDKGRNRVEVFTDEDEYMATRFGEMAWIERVQSALRQGRLCLYAQPLQQLHANCDTRNHYELLLRLMDENGNVVSPGAFLPAVERYGIMPTLDRWVVEFALRHIAAHAQRDPDAVQRTVYAINLSGAALGDEQFLAAVKALFAQYQVPYGCICFEITETQVINNLQAAIHFMTELRALGCAFALDDFGAGMSSFAYLKQLPVDVLKVDGQIVKGMVQDRIDYAMVEMIALLARAMGIKTIGEYAEDEAIVHALRRIGVDYAQGYGIARPAPFFAADALGSP